MFSMYVTDHLLLGFEHLYLCVLFSVLDIEWSQERFYFGDNVLPCFESGIPLLKHRLHQLPDANNVSSFLLSDSIIPRYSWLFCRTW
jgi:hypothetical protein